MLNIEGKNIGSIMTSGKIIETLASTGKIIWQAIRANFFTKDGFYIITKDEKIFNTKE